MWISGESYGGHYVPNLLKYFDDNAQSSFTVRGFLVGNAWTVAAIDNLGAATMWYQHQLISDDTYDTMLEYCDWATIGPLKRCVLESNRIEWRDDDIARCRCVCRSTHDPDLKKCNDAVDAALVEAGKINLYDVYADACLPSQQVAHFLGQLGAARDHPLARAHAVLSGRSRPCINDYVKRYLNRKDVRAAIHVEIDYAWTECSAFLNYSRADLLTSMLPVYKALLSTRRYALLVYSGDTDGVVPTQGTRGWLRELGLKTVCQPLRTVPHTHTHTHAHMHINRFQRIVRGTATTGRSPGVFRSTTA